MPQHHGVPRGPHRDRLRLSARPRPDDPREHALRGASVHGKSLRGKLRAEQLGSRFGTGGGDSQVPVGSRAERGRLRQRRLAGEPCPREQPGRRRRPPAADPVRPQVSVRRDRLRRVTLGAGRAGPGRRVLQRRVEQVWPGGRPAGRGRCHALERQPAYAGPRPARVRPPAAEQQPVHRGDVPARGEAHPARDQVPRGLLRPGRPPWPDLTVGQRELCRRGHPAAVRCRHRRGAVGGDGDSDEVPACHPRAAQPGDEGIVAGQSDATAHTGSPPRSSRSARTVTATGSAPGAGSARTRASG